MQTFTDDVNGKIIGGDYSPFALHYDGRKQGSTFYAATTDAAVNIGNAMIAEYRKEFGPAFELIYPKASKLFTVKQLA